MEELLKIEEADFFDLFGEKIPVDQWAYMFKRDPLNLKTQINGFSILTVWTGVDSPKPMLLVGSRYAHRRWEPNETPMIYKSMVFNPDLQLIDDGVYPDYDSAVEGHNDLVSRYEGS